MIIDRKADGYKNGMFTWFMGEVEDINDKENLNRVKVRCFGYYDNPEIKTADLPWATVMMPTTSASLKGNGANHHLEVGSWVVGFFRDGPSAQDPIVMGSIATQTDGTQDIPSNSSTSLSFKLYKYWSIITSNNCLLSLVLLSIISVKSRVNSCAFSGVNLLFILFS